MAGLVKRVVKYSLEVYIIFLETIGQSDALEDVQTGATNLVRSAKASLAYTY